MRAIYSVEVGAPPNVRLEAVVVHEDNLTVTDIPGLIAFRAEAIAKATAWHTFKARMDALLVVLIAIFGLDALATPAQVTAAIAAATHP